MASWFMFMLVKDTAAITRSHLHMLKRFAVVRIQLTAGSAWEKEVCFGGLILRSAFESSADPSVWACERPDKPDTSVKSWLDKNGTAHRDTQESVKMKNNNNQKWTNEKTEPKPTNVF